VLSGREQFYWAGAIAGLEPAVIQSRTAELAIALHLDRYLDLRIAGYSKGNAKKLAFALALMSDPRVLILDEPFEGVDPLGVSAMKEILDQFRRAGASILVSSHMLALLEDLCTGFVVLHRGKVVFEGDRRAVTALATDLVSPPSEGRGGLESIFMGLVAPDRCATVLRTLASASPSLEGPAPSGGTS
jgi:ABC-2 type transport system ATP-binding protein